MYRRPKLRTCRLHLECQIAERRSCSRSLGEQRRHLHGYPRPSRICGVLSERNDRSFNWVPSERASQNMAHRFPLSKGLNAAFSTSIASECSVLPDWHPMCSKVLRGETQWVCCAHLCADPQIAGLTRTYEGALRQRDRKPCSPHGGDTEATWDSRNPGILGIEDALEQFPLDFFASFRRHSVAGCSYPAFRRHMREFGKTLAQCGVSSGACHCCDSMSSSEVCVPPTCRSGRPLRTAHEMLMLASL